MAKRLMNAKAEEFENLLAGWAADAGRIDEELGFSPRESTWDRIRSRF